MVLLKIVRTSYPKTAFKQADIQQTMKTLLNRYPTGHRYIPTVDKVFPGTKITSRRLFTDPSMVLEDGFRLEDVTNHVVPQAVALARRNFTETLDAAGISPKEVGCVMSSNDTPVHPSLNRVAVHDLLLPNCAFDTTLIPGCSGGVAGLDHAYRFLKAYPRSIAVSTNVDAMSKYFMGGYGERLHSLLTKEAHREALNAAALSSLADAQSADYDSLHGVQRSRQFSTSARPAEMSDEELAYQIKQELVMSCFLGDGSATAVLVGEDHPRYAEWAQTSPTISNFYNEFIPNTINVVYQQMTHTGFRAEIGKELSSVATPMLHKLAERMLKDNGLTIKDVDHWIIHPGGPKILKELQRLTGLNDHDLRHSWDSFRANGNTGSSSIMDVLARFMQENPVVKKGSIAVLISVGPGLRKVSCILRW
jgi:predicted naringenin-chalcone synthase